MRVKGKLIRKSLKTDTLSVARLRLVDMEKLERQNAESRVDVTHGKLTFGKAVKIYNQRVSGDVSMKPRTKEYYEGRAVALLKSWPELLKEQTLLELRCCLRQQTSGQKAAGYNRLARNKKYADEFTTRPFQKLKILGAVLDNAEKVLSNWA
jgi:hypothetical protein